MASVWQTFQMAGWTAYLCLLLAILGVPLSLLAVGLVVARTRAARGLALGVLCFGLLAPAVGAFGMYRGRALVDSVLADVEPALRGRIRDQGYYEAEQALYVGLAAGSLPFVLGAVSLGLSFVITPRRAAEEQ